MKTQIQVRRDTTANWLANKDVVPAAGEPCFDLKLGTLKIGDGVTTYENLKAISGASAAHYEGVKAAGESDNDVITRVLTAAGVTAEKDDIFVVKSLIADGKYSYTADSKESELYFYDANGEMKNISERKQFETLTEAQAWVKTYDCAGHIISVHNGSDWVPYIVSADGKLSPVNAGDISVGDVKVIDGGAANGIQ